MRTTGGCWRLGHRPALDGIRGVAIGLVMAFHSQVPGFFGSGTIGVTVFFTLSGFLITTLLLEEQARSGRISLVSFWRRRAVRLMPALIFLVAVLIVLSFFVGPWLAKPAAVPVVLFYMANWVPASGGYLGGLEHTWSLAVEEQFYVVWPLVVVSLARFGKRILMSTAIGGAIAAVMVRMVVWDGGSGTAHAYYGSDARADGLLVGCALAVAMHGQIEGRVRPAVASAVAAVLVLMGLITGPAFHLVVPTLVACFTAIVMWAVVQGEYAGWLALAPLRWAGQRSYGLYLWHAPVAVAVNRVEGLSWGTKLVVVVAASLALATLSWTLVEKPCQRFRYARRPDPLPAPIAAQVSPAASG